MTKEHVCLFCTSLDLTFDIPFDFVSGKKHRRKTSNASEETKASTIEKKNRGRAVAWKT